MRGLTFNNDGTKMFTVGQQYDKVYEYDLSTAFDITTLSYSDDSYSISSQESYPTEIRFNHDGTKMYISGSSGDDINEYTYPLPLIYHQTLLPLKVVLVILQIVAVRPGFFF